MKLLDDAARRLLDRFSIAVRPGATAMRQGGHRSKALASGVEFADHRAYVPGDDFRRIDWKAFARNGSLNLRQFEEERDARVYVMIDLSGSMSRGKPPKIDVAKKLAAAFAYVGMRQYDRSMVLPFGDDLERASRPLRSMSDLPEVDRFLAACSAGGNTHFSQTVRTLAERHDKRGLVVVISDLMKPEGFPDTFRTLGALGHELRVVHLACEEDRRPTLNGELELFDAYTKEIDKHVGACRDATRRAGGRFVELDVDMAGDTLMKKAFAGQEGKKR